MDKRTERKLMVVLIVVGSFLLLLNLVDGRWPSAALCAAMVALATFNAVRLTKAARRQ